MSLFGDLNGVDMNNPATLELYSEVLLFKNDYSKDEIVFSQRSYADQLTLQALAHKMSLECEYSSITKVVRISRPISQHSPLLDDSQNEAFWNEVLGGHDSQQFPSDSNLMSVSNDDLDNIFNDINGGVISPASYGNHSAANTMSGSESTHRFHQLEEIFDQGTHMDMSYFSACQAATNTTSGVNSTHQPQLNNNRQEGGLPSEDYFNPYGQLLLKVPSQHLNFEMITSELRSFPVFVNDDPFESDGNWSTQVSQICVAEAPEVLRKRNLSTRASTPGSSESSPHETCGNELGLYQCDLCPKTYVRAEQISRHRKREHSDAKVRHYCPNCIRSFDRRLHLTRHRVSCKIELSTSKGRSRSQSIDVEGSVYSSNSAECYSEIVFDSSSANSRESSARSGSSVSSNRRGPLSRLARAGMQAVKEIGACWRCKVLKKSCDVYSPCALCPNTYIGSNWASIGCRRGYFQSQAFNLCRRPHLGDFGPSFQEIDSKILSVNVTGDFEVWLQREISDDETSSFRRVIPSGKIQVLRGFRRQLYFPSMPNISENVSARLAPLQQCALAITWNLLECPAACQVIFREGSLDDLERLLPHAILYQAEQQDDQLVAQSLICLRTCAEILRAKESGLLTPIWHSLCTPEKCKYDCVASLNMHLRLYTEELSRVVFKKENLKDRLPWWLSAFYSFCIQSYVRRALIVLNTNTNNEAVASAPGQLEVAYTLFYDNARSNADAHERVSLNWKTSTYTRRWWLRQAMSMNVERLDTVKKSGMASNPLKSSRTRFDHLLKVSKFSREMFPEEFSRNPVIEAEDYLYLPVRVFCAMNPADPVANDGPGSLESRLSAVHASGARLAVNYSSWQEEHILSPF